MQLSLSIVQAHGITVPMHILVQRKGYIVIILSHIIINICLGTHKKRLIDTALLPHHTIL